jgi:hypothetical protein
MVEAAAAAASQQARVDDRLRHKPQSPRPNRPPCGVVFDAICMERGRLVITRESPPDHNRLSVSIPPASAVANAVKQCRYSGVFHIV